MIAELERRKALQFEDEAETMSNLEYVARWVEGGNTMLQLAISIMTEGSIDLRPEALGSYLYTTWPEDAGPRLKAARLRGAHPLVEQAISITDNASTADREQLKHAEMQTGVRMLVAGRWNREELGQTPAFAINNNVINLGSLHLKAMEAIQAGRPVARIASSSDGAVEVEQVPA